MFREKHLSGLVVSILLGTITANNLSVKAIDFVKDQNDTSSSTKTAGISCYLTGKMEEEAAKSAYQIKLEKLEKLYKQGKISEDIYNERKQECIQQIKTAHEREKQKIYNKRIKNIEKNYTLNGDKETYQRQLELLNLEISYFDKYDRWPEDDDIFTRLNIQKSDTTMSQEEFEKQKIIILKSYIFDHQA